MNLNGKKRKSLVEAIGKAVILAHKEPTESLEVFLKHEGFIVEIIRSDPAEEIKYPSSTYRTLIFGHCKAWEITLSQSKPTLIMEADFVPVIGFGKLPLPYDATNDNNVGMAWLYACGPRMHSVSKEGFIEGGGGGVQAYILSPLSAELLLKEFIEVAKQKSSDGTRYYPWDTELIEFFTRRSRKNYISFRHYGEHGGVIRKEHKGKSKILWGGHHRADVLYNKLAFMPLYAIKSKHPKIKYCMERLMGWSKGMLRLFVGRFLGARTFMRSSCRWRLLRYALLRYFALPY